MLSNLKVLVTAVLLKIVMKRRFSIIQWEDLALLLIGISINQMRSSPDGPTEMGLPIAMAAYIYTFIFQSSDVWKKMCTKLEKLLGLSKQRLRNSIKRWWI